MSAVIFSDLDGTLLDHDDYSHSAAAASLAWLKARQIDVILNTSKTVAETRHWHHKLELGAPYVVENGAAAYRADGSLLQAWGMPRPRLLGLAQTLRTKSAYDFMGFSDVDVAQIRAWTGLNAQDAAAASRRDWSEPIKWQDTPARRHRFAKELAACGLQLLRGGRFWHIQGPHDKGLALRELAQAQTGAKTLIALGDGGNDVAMLKAADIAVCVRSAHHDYPDIGTHPCAYHTQAYGPAGWAEAITELRHQGHLPA